MLPIIFWFLTFYFLYKFTFEFVVPLIMASKNVRSKMEDSRQQQRFDSSHSSNHTEKKSAGSSSKGDYIDFEEIH